MGEASRSKDEGKPVGLTSSVVSIPLPRAFGRLILLKLLARGGMGDVYLAATTGIEGAERPVVVKTVRRDHIHDGSFLARFLDEARVQAQLNHPGVAQILEASTDDNGEPFTVVEYVEGRSLADVRQRAVQVGAHIGWPDAVALCIEMGQALAHVHERAGTDGSPLGVVHRDLSPQNVMVGYAGELKLIDFGTARGQNRRCHTVAGVVFAKPGYVAPEVARQQVGDARIDVYAMGVMLWELCAGKRLLAGDPQKHLEEVAAGKFEIPHLAATRGVPKRLDEIIQKLCANDPDDRYTSAGRAAADLAKVLAHAPATKSGERSVRARIAAVMHSLWPQEPARSRSDFAKLLKQARTLRKKEDETPAVSSVMEAAASKASLPEDPSILAGTPYRLIEKIGQGAAGEVWEAEHTELARRYAIKILSPAHAAAHDAIERFRREARAVAKLRHPSLVELHDFGKSLDGRVFLAMELLEGETLDARIEKGIGWVDATHLAIEVTHALEAAHGAGVVHRDLKPANLFLTKDGPLKLLDFGVAMALSEADGEEPRQKGFAVFGTPEYMAPEQVAGDPVDARTDLYALGCVLYEMLTGAPPFEGTSPVVVMGKQLREQPERVASRATRRLPAELARAVDRALSKSKDDRFASAADMRAALEAALAAPARRLTRAKRVVTVAVGACVLLLGAATAKSRGLTMPTSLHLPSLGATTEIPTVAVESLPQVPGSEPSPTVAAVAPAPAPEPQPVVAASPAPAPKAPTTAAAHEDAPEADGARAGVASAAPAPSEATADDSDDDEETAAPRRPALLRAASTGASSAAARLASARDAARAKPTDPKLLRAWARAAVSAHELREARRAAERWALYDGSSEPRVVLASVLDASGRKREARSVLEEYLATHPTSTDARRLLSRLDGGTRARVSERGGSHEPRRAGRSRAGRVQLHPPDPVSGDE
ncbi:MAG: serine/threonine-protein kinase [Polyangiaceae bacterium]